MITIYYYYYLHPRKGSLRQPYARTRLTDERMYGRTKTQTNRQTDSTKKEADIQRLSILIIQSVQLLNDGQISE